MKASVSYCVRWPDGMYNCDAFDQDFIQTGPAAWDPGIGPFEMPNAPVLGMSYLCYHC